MKKKLEPNKVSFRTLVSWDRIYHGKGTVAEPWPEVDDVMRKPEVQAEVEAVHRAWAKAKFRSKAFL